MNPKQIEITRTIGTRNQVILSKDIMGLLGLNKDDLIQIEITVFGTQQAGKDIVRIRSSQRITIPKDIVSALGLEEGMPINIKIKAIKEAATNVSK